MTVEQRNAIILVQQLRSDNVINDARATELREGIRTGTVNLDDVRALQQKLVPINSHARPGVHGDVATYTGGSAGAAFRGQIDALQTPEEALAVRDGLFLSLNNTITA